MNRILPDKNIDLSLDILRLLQEEALVRFPAFPEAFGKLRPAAVSGLLAPLGTDGLQLYFDPDLLIPMFLTDSDHLRYLYLHVHLHCLCLHVLQDHGTENPLWDEACDLSVTLIAGLLTGENDFKKLIADLQSLTDSRFPDVNLWIDASRVFEQLKQSPGLRQLAASCACDTHLLWPRPSQKDKAQACSGKSSAGSAPSSVLQSHRSNMPDTLWSAVHDKLRRELSNGFGKRGSAGGTDAASADLHRKDAFDYRQFLHRFAVPREEALLDTDSFDYIPYHYGLTQYHNMPFLEPLEYCEVNRLDELAIAIDTSGSCSGKIVRRFLEETWNILRQKENFFSRMRLHLIQCDSMIQEHRIFTSVEEWEASISEIRILGHGNTDFCPVFDYLNTLIRKKEIRHLRGLLYFTDGDGIFPRTRPPYDTAFVFLNRSTEKQKIPDWAIRLNLNLPENF